MKLPQTLLVRLGWRSGTRLLGGKTDDGVLLTACKAPGDVGQ